LRHHIFLPNWFVQDFSFDAEHGLKALLAAKEELASSSFYSEMRTLLLASVADSPVACLFCFGLGRLASPVTRHQAALLLLLKENSKFAFLLVPVQLRPFFCLS
jgi:hypothetical protein